MLLTATAPPMPAKECTGRTLERLRRFLHEGSASSPGGGTAVAPRWVRRDETAGRWLGATAAHECVKPLQVSRAEPPPLGAFFATGTLALARMQEASVIRPNRLFLIVACSLVTSGIFACGDVATAPQGPEFARVPVTPPPTFTRCQYKTYGVTSGLIGPGGGRLKVGGHVFLVPAGALKATTLITMETPAGSTRRVVFGPEGLTFAADKPAHLIMSYQDCTIAPGANQAVAYVNDSFVILETTPSVSNPASFTVDSKLTHFSNYMLVSTYAVVY